MASEPDEITEAIKRALDAAEAANFAAEDIARISAAHRSFADSVARGQKRSAVLAGGAALGALLGLGLGGAVHGLGTGAAHAQPGAFFADAQLGVCAALRCDLGPLDLGHAHV